VSLHLVIDDPSPCATCHGDGWINQPMAWGGHTYEAICPDCKCSECGMSTETPPQCRDCHEAERRADEDAAKAYREGRYE